MSRAHKIIFTGSPAEPVKETDSAVKRLTRQRNYDKLLAASDFFAELLAKQKQENPQRRRIPLET